MFVRSKQQCNDFSLLKIKNIYNRDRFLHISFYLAAERRKKTWETILYLE